MTKVRSDMVANVWKVTVSVGQTVAEGEVLVVLESMKMEIPVEAPHAGVVREVAVVEGGEVAEGAVIAVLDD